MQEREHLRTRWLTPEGVALRTVVLERLRARDDLWGDSLQRLPFSDEVPYHEDLREIDLSGEDLTQVNLYGATLDGARFDGCTLHRACLSKASMKGASFVNARMSKANLAGVSAPGASFDAADLTDATMFTARYRGASLRDAILTRVGLENSDLRDVDFRGAHVENTDIGGSDLAGALWDGSQGNVLDRWYPIARGGHVPTAPLKPVTVGGSNLPAVRGLLTQIEQAVADDPERCFSFDTRGVATLTAAGRQYCAGSFSMPSIGELRARLEAHPRSAPGSIRLCVLKGVHPLTDIGTLQATAPEGTLFQIASQFNALKAPGPTIVPVHRYVNYPSQGSRASISAFPGTFLRHYFAISKTGVRFEQTDADCLNLLNDVFDSSVADVRGGHLSIANVHDRTRLATLLEERFDRIRVGVHDELEVAFGHDWSGPVPQAPSHRITQVFTSTIALGPHGPDRTWQEVAIARALLRAAYLGTLLAAIELGKRTVALTLLGGGPFGNLPEDMVEAVYWAMSEAEPYVDGTLTVVLNARSLVDAFSDHGEHGQRGTRITFEEGFMTDYLVIPIPLRDNLKR